MGKTIKAGKKEIELRQERKEYLSAKKPKMKPFSKKERI